LIYWVAAAAKLSPESFSVWWKEATAIYYALHNDFFATYLGFFLLRFPQFLEFITRTVIGFEVIGPVFLIFPFATELVRTIAVAAFIGLHIGFGLCLAVNPFPWIGSIAMIPFLPSSFWKRVEKYGLYNWIKFRWLGFTRAFAGLLPKKSIKMPLMLFESANGGLSALGNIIVLSCLSYVLYWNLGNICEQYGLLRLPRGAFGTIGLEQRWNMFAPPDKDAGWYVIPGKLKNGEKVDIFKNGAAIRWEKPNLPSAMYKNNRWRKYMAELRDETNAKYLPFYASYLCRDWNKNHQENLQLEELEIVYMKETTPPYPDNPTVEKVTLLKYSC
jgi:hypothetical protein